MRNPNYKHLSDKELQEYYDRLIVEHSKGNYQSEEMTHIEIEIRERGL